MPLFLINFLQKTSPTSEWLEFFLKGVVHICKKAIETSNKIIDLREKNLSKTSSLGKASINAMVLMKHLNKSPMLMSKRLKK